MTTGFVKEQNLEIQIQRQMGCMAGFLQIFDRHHILTGKRFYSTKRLPPPPLVDTTTSESEKSAPQSPPNPTDSRKPLEKSKQTPAAAAELPPKPPLPLPIFELKSGTKSSSSWKFSKEAPRLSLDSRATTDAKGGLHPKQIRTTTSAAAVASNGGNSIASAAADVDQQQHRSTSVIARLMGLDPYPNSSDSEPEKKPELRRSASESRVSKDLFQSRFITDGGNFYSKQQTQSHSSHTPPTDAHFADPNNQSIKKAPEGLHRGRLNSTPPWKAPPQQRKNFFDSGDVFPEPKQTVSTISIYGEIEKRIKVRGIDETSKDLETLKQILEALQLKGLLHPKQPPPQQNEAVRRHRNFVYDESPIVLMKPIRSSDPNGRNQVRRNYSLAGETSPSVSPMRERNVRSPTRGGGRGPGTGPSPITRSNSPVKPRQLSVETQRKASPVHSPKRRAVPDPTATNQSQRRKKPTSQIRQKDDESSSISGSSITTVSTDTERSKGDEHKEGRNILERCDKLLRSIAEMSAAADMQPSPVSVLDSSFYKDDSLTPSPVTTKRNLDFTDQPGELEEETWSPVVSPIHTKWVETSDDREFAYISDILRASSHHHHHLQDESDVFLLLEKQQFLKGNHDTCKASTLQRKLIFDAISEITGRDKQLPPWNKCATVPSLDKVWSEFQTIRERPEKTGEDLFETVCGVLKRDLAITAWGDFPIEMSEGVLDIERLIFKDLIGEIIGDLAVLAAASGMLSSAMPMRRKLVF
ncbi:hypothetical protein ABFS82_14G202300 [Erythranthe guttata]|uniref:DUF4378 domain-containing protein n=1 Tax=Erythranthe guttata TaxID=4155 RepID=A0A022PUG0_ERYGU|nr:PREDICTED: protein LONGIFOLIA 1-like [Erythranthe guttata]EYU17890.1 hypothetical protein MIMGU_mgv1a001830mg [Erythranthe guttata]|eukprot:XP_012829020.1 PREDICTED: protein LONGIFOLIA 1-like [Erythranthe guttata]